MGAILGIVFGVLSVLLCIFFAAFFILRRARRRARRASVDSARWHLRPHSYDSDDSSSRVISSVWTWTGSMSADSHFESRHEPSMHSLDFKFGDLEKDASPHDPHSYAPSPCPSPSPSPDPRWAETQPLTHDAPFMPQLQPPPHPHPNPHHDIPHLAVPSSPAIHASSSSELLTLAGTDFTGARLLGGHDSGLGRSVSGVSHATASSGYVQSVEAL
ncbi:hypothetical protein GSI_08568 [Ganoderma sinense ZZ0214-1]|uniref:Uncharacterized protein n=1 Tax=Ganoderma sinense ZZ0214-1 TaxID=1077348 RepID=A0A2G8S431_9APHY|nr:hypothetical protein GSI_08568 [Ganoderma sinense ZZ0214-1]